MERVELTVEKRDEMGSGAVGRLRKAKSIPAVVYGKKFTPINVKIDNKNIMVLKKIDYSENTLISLSLKGASEKLSVLIKDFQIHPLTEEVVHIDFINVSLTDKIKVKVPIHLKGESEGVKAGGILESILKDLDIECVPTAIPESIDIDVSALKVGDNIHVSDIKAPAGSKILNPEKDVILSIVVPVAEEEAAAVEPGPTEPEVIKEKPKTEEGKEEGAKEGKEAKDEKKKEEKKDEKKKDDKK